MDGAFSGLSTAPRPRKWEPALIAQTKTGSSEAGLDQIRRGLAWHFKQYENEQGAEDRAAYVAADAEARQAGRGLWRDRTPVPPWEWREGRRKPQRTASGGLVSAG